MLNEYINNQLNRHVQAKRFVMTENPDQESNQIICYLLIQMMEFDSNARFQHRSPHNKAVNH